MHQMRDFSPYAVQMRSALLVATVGFVGGCTHHRPLTELSEVVGGELTVETTSHQRIDARAYPSADGVQITNEDRQPIATGEIDEVTEIKRGRGALEGGGIGALGGIAAGVILGFAAGDDPCDENVERDCYYAFTAGQNAMIFGIIFGGLGGLGGLVVGAIIGSRDVYKMSEGSMIQQIRPTGPPGSVGGVTITF